MRVGERWTDVLRSGMMMCREPILRSFMWQGEVAKREKCVNDVMEIARMRPSEKMVLPLSRIVKN